jgi:hypothetical protein
LPVLVQVTCVPASIVNENGLKEPPPPEMVTPAEPVGVQVCGLGDGLGLGERPGLGDGLGLGEGLTPWAKIPLGPAPRKIRLRRTTMIGLQKERFASRVCGERLDNVRCSL